MRALKVAVVVMGVLIVVGTIGLVVGIVRRSTTPAAHVAPSIAAILNEPEGTRMAGIAAVQDQLAVQLEGGGVDRIVLINPHSGVVTGRISLAH